MKYKRYIIYGLVDPRDNVVRYIGRSSNGLGRPKRHFQGKEHLLYDDHCHRWVRSLLSVGLVPKITIIEEFAYSQDINDVLNQAEIAWIQHYKESGVDLTNSSPGGDVRAASEETREKIGAAHRGKKRSEEARANIAAGRKGMKFSEEHCANMSKVRMGRKRPPEECEKISNSMKGKKKTEEHLRNLSTAAKNRKYTAEGLRKIAEAARRREEVKLAKKCASEEVTP